MSRGEFLPFSREVVRPEVQSPISVGDGRHDITAGLGGRLLQPLMSFVVLPNTGTIHIIWYGVVWDLVLHVTSSYCGSGLNGYGQSINHREAHWHGL